MPSIAFQDLIPDNLCYGCGPQNHNGLRIKSYWEGEESVCTYQPERHHSAGPPQFLNGGIIKDTCPVRALFEFGRVRPRGGLGGAGAGQLAEKPRVRSY